MKSHIFLLAHCDDELFFVWKIAELTFKNEKVQIVYLTDYKNSSRLLESIESLGQVGVSSNCLHHLGAELNIQDGMLSSHLEKVFVYLENKFLNSPETEVWTHDWEGGHPDHDAAYLLALKAQKNGLIENFFTTSQYNAAQTIGPLFRVMHLLNDCFSIQERVIKLGEGLRYFALMFKYRSQIKTFIGLGPFIFFRYVIVRKISFKIVSTRKDYILNKPHEGVLLREKRFGSSFEQFSEIYQYFINSK